MEKLTRRELFKLPLGLVSPDPDKQQNLRIQKLEDNQAVLTNNEGIIIDVLNNNSEVFNDRLEAIEGVLFPVYQDDKGKRA